MQVNRAYKLELLPSNKQRTNLFRFAGTSRFVWNWGLADRNNRYRNNTGDYRYTTAINQNKEIVKLKNSDLAWLKDVSKTVPQDALRDLEKAFKNFFKGTHGFPKFKKRGVHDSFRMTSTVRLFANGFQTKCKLRRAKNHSCSKTCLQKFTAAMIQLPRLGKIRIKEVPHLGETVKISSATVSRQADRWFVSLTVTEKIEKHIPEGDCLGVDAGLIHSFIASDGKKYDNLKPLKKRLRRLRKLNKELHRRKKGSENRARTRMKIARVHSSITNIRSDFLHKITTDLAKSFKIVVIEDLNVKGMMRNHKLAFSISDVGWGEFFRQLRYKCGWYGSQLLEAPRFFPSSKLCSNCGCVRKNLMLSDRTYRCSNCGLEMDRDDNAAMNLKKYGEMYAKDPMVAVSWTETLNACGDHVRPFDGLPNDKGNADET
ncbi:MAG: RNA-guided endonuclease InsQ/TnpB family protein [Candidatus Kariarchaeaceae archaeon]